MFLTVYALECDSTVSTEGYDERGPLTSSLKFQSSTRPDNPFQAPATDNPSWY